MPVRHLLGDPVDVVRLHRAEPVWPEAENFFVEMIFRFPAVHEISDVDDVSADGFGARRHRHWMAGLDELNYISFGVLRAEPVATVAAGAQFGAVICVMRPEVLEQGVRVRGVEGDAG